MSYKKILLIVYYEYYWAPKIPEGYLVQCSGEARGPRGKGGSRATGVQMSRYPPRVGGCLRLRWNSFIAALMKLIKVTLALDLLIYSVAKQLHEYWQNSKTEVLGNGSTHIVRKVTD